MAFKKKKDTRHEILEIFNHGFDGIAHKQELSEEQLYQQILIEMRERELDCTIEEIIDALQMGERAHFHLHDGGKLSLEKRNNANGAVNRLLGLLIRDQKKQ